MTFDNLISYFSEFPLVALLIYVAAILLLSVLFHYLIKLLLFRIVKIIISKQAPAVWKSMESFKLFNKSALFFPLILTYIGVKYFLVIEHPNNVNELILNFIIIGLIIVFIQFINSLLSFILNELIRKYDLNTALVRTIHQVFKIILVLAAIISVISILINKSPVVILSSLGALTAIIVLVFKDTILGFVASLQVTLLGIVKEGDWIEMPKFNADGNILDINISSIRVQNWDKTITTIPTYALVSEPVKNWKGMELSNTRRIKRSIHIDITSVKFCSEALINNMKSVNYLSGYLEKSQDEIQTYNKAQENSHQPLNIRSLTNLGLFREYMYKYLENNPNINQQRIVLVRQLQSDETGIPIEIYCFANTTNWVKYENIQSDIFDHIFAVINLFELKVIQTPIKLSTD